MKIKATRYLGSKIIQVFDVVQIEELSDCKYLKGPGVDWRIRHNLRFHSEAISEELEDGTHFKYEVVYDSGVKIPKKSQTAPPRASE